MTHPNPDTVWPHEFIAVLRSSAETEPPRISQMLLTAATQIEIWMDRWESERQAHEATMKHADKAMDEMARLL